MTREAGAAGTPEPHPGGSRRRRGWFAERVRTWGLELFEPEFSALASKLASLRAALDAGAARQSEILSRESDLQARLELLSRQVEPYADGSLQQHLETRIDQALGELAELRGAYLATRGEFEGLRDGSVPAVVQEVEQLRDERLPHLDGSLAGVQQGVAGLQAELELLRDTTVSQVAASVDGFHESIVRLQAELTNLREGRIAQTERDAAGMQGAIKELQAELGTLAEVRLARGEKDLAGLQHAVEVLQRELRATNEERLTRDEEDLASVQGAIVGLQGGLESLSAERVARAEDGLAGLQEGLAAVQNLAEEVRDARLPALAGRTDALVEQLHTELTTLSGLVDRLIAGEPLHVSVDPALEAVLPAAIARSSAALVDALRGSREEILGRVLEYVPLLREHEPVLDLGCGRGELLEALQRDGVEARGIDSDPAMVSACVRRGLAATVGEIPAALAEIADSSLGAVAAIHLLEHLSAAGWMSLLDAARRILRPGGVIVVECPNPGSLRVGGGLYWADPTHRSPVHPQALELVARAVGFEVVETRFLHPFPSEQNLARDEQPRELRRLAERLDEWLSGPRDFLLVGRKPAAGA